MASGQTVKPATESAATKTPMRQGGTRKKVVITLAAMILVLVIGFVTVVAMQPSEFHIERSATMSAPAEEVFAQVNNFHKWDAWSPWLELDPNAKSTFEGPTSGEGAIFRWAGNAEVGEGSMTIIESNPNEHIRINLHFLKPFEDTAITDFTFKEQGDKTTTTWSMDGKHNFISKAMCLLIMDMDEMIGSKYEEGLASIKAIVEAPPSTEQPSAKEPIADSPITKDAVSTDSSVKKED